MYDLGFPCGRAGCEWTKVEATPSATPLSEEELALLEAGELHLAALRSLHEEVCPEWDDMTLAGWLRTKSKVDLLSIEMYARYIACYAKLELEGREYKE